jgi:hypothetical protein
MAGATESSATALTNVGANSPVIEFAVLRNMAGTLSEEGKWRESGALDYLGEVRGMSTLDEELQDEELQPDRIAPVGSQVKVRRRLSGALMFDAFAETVRVALRVMGASIHGHSVAAPFPAI